MQRSNITLIICHTIILMEDATETTETGVKHKLLLLFATLRLRLKLAKNIRKSIFRRTIAFVVMILFPLSV